MNNLGLKALAIINLSILQITNNHFHFSLFLLQIKKPDYGIYHTKHIEMD